MFHCFILTSCTEGILHHSANGAQEISFSNTVNTAKKIIASQQDSLSDIYRTCAWS